MMVHPPFYYPIAAELSEVELLLQNLARVEDPTLAAAVLHVISSGGKRLRPALSLLCAKLQLSMQYHPAPLPVVLPGLQKAIFVAAGIEALHTTSLVHDDIIDHAALRRGVPTINSLWGERLAIVAGDYFYAQAIRFFSQTESLPALHILANIASMLACGEAREIAYKHAVGNRTTQELEQDYLLTIQQKTAALFSGACEVGATVVANVPDHLRWFGAYGKQLGIALQIADDMLDIWGQEGQSGKKCFQDWQEGILTLPVIYCMEENPQCRAIWQATLANPATLAGYLNQILQLLELSHARQRCQDKVLQAIQEAKNCLAIFPPSNYRQALEDAADYIGELLYERKHERCDSGSASGRQTLPNGQSDH